MSIGPSRSLDEVIDRCIEDITAGRRSVGECLAAYPEHRDALEPLLTAAASIRTLPRVPERAPDPARRAAFMAELARTPQQSPSRRPHLTLPRFAGFRGRLIAFASVAAPAAVAAAVALVLVLGRAPSPASASTLTIFSGGVEQEREGRWQPVADGDALAEGTRLRTSADGRAMLTFADGSTVTLAATTEMVLARVKVNGVRDVVIDQVSGRLWNDVVADPRSGAHYIVRAQGVVTTVTGTVFETAIADGVTSVTTAAGIVEVAAGGEAIEVGHGESVRATALEIRALAVVRPAATLRVDAPYAASLIAADGAATGTRPDGVSFSQIAGATTTDPASGPQRIDLLQATPGDYTLVLRRFADGSGVVVIAVGGKVLTLPVSGPNDIKVQLRVAEVNGQPVIELLRRDDVADIVDAARERVVETRRTTDAVSVAASRAAAAVQPSAAAAGAAAPATTPMPRRSSGDDRSSGADRRGSGDDDDRAGARPATADAVQAAPLDAARARLRAALSSRDRNALEHVVAGLLADGSDIARADAVALIVAEGVRTRAARTRMRVLITGDGGTATRLRAALGEAALGELARPVGELLDGVLPLAPQSTPKPKPREDRRSPTPSPTPGGTNLLPRLGITATPTPTATPKADQDERDSSDQNKDNDKDKTEGVDEDSRDRDSRPSSSVPVSVSPALVIVDAIDDAVATTRERASSDASERSGDDFAVTEERANTRDERLRTTLRDPRRVTLPKPAKLRVEVGRSAAERGEAPQGTAGVASDVSSADEADASLCSPKARKKLKQPACDRASVQPTSGPGQRSR